MISRLKLRLRHINALIWRDGIILSDRDRKSLDNRVNLHYFKRGDGGDNLGDYLSTVVFEHMLLLRGIANVTDRKKHLYAIGSILAFGFQNATVWGTGLLLEPKASSFYKTVLNPRIRKLDIRMVRGPRTRAVLLEKGYDCPEIYGDPAILLPEIYTPVLKGPKKDCTVILNHNSKLVYGENLSIATSDYKSFIDVVANSKKVISGSMHGAILAESYGVPAVILSDAATQKGCFKFDDYYNSTGRYTYPVAPSIEEAFQTEPPPLPRNLDKLRQNLHDTFPYDLWGLKAAEATKIKEHALLH